ncbi:MAG: acylphosphatase [Candidatus Dadabacteria bacterium]|nr:MAG: acylphosphatase [Candidatus Dadabacteria bacterium]
MTHSPDELTLTTERGVRMRIYGTVQGVAFRAATVEQARALGLTGWVRNRTDGSVEIEAYGPRAQIGELIRWAHQGPPAASVSRVDVSELGPGEMPPADFSVRDTF